MKLSFPLGHRCRCLLLALVTLLICLPGVRASAQANPMRAGAATMRLRGQVPLAALARARALGRLPSRQTLSLSLALPLRDPAGLQSFLDRLYDPADPLYHSSSRRVSSRAATARPSSPMTLLLLLPARMG